MEEQKNTVNVEDLDPEVMIGDTKVGQYIKPNRAERRRLAREEKKKNKK